MAWEKGLVLRVACLCFGRQAWLAQELAISNWVARLAENSWITFAENRWITLAENTWITLAENRWITLGRVLTPFTNRSGVFR